LDFGGGNKDIPIHIKEFKVKNEKCKEKDLRPLFFQKKSGQKRNLHPDEFLGQILSSFAKKSNSLHSDRDFS